MIQRLRNELKVGGGGGAEHTSPEGATYEGGLGGPPPENFEN